MPRQQCSHGLSKAGHTEVSTYLGFLKTAAPKDSCERGTGVSKGAANRSQSVVRVLTVTAPTLITVAFLQDFFLVVAGACQGCQQMIHVTLQHDLYKSWVWPAAVTFRLMLPHYASEMRGACLPAEFQVLPGPANSGRTIGTLGPWIVVWGSVSRSVAFVLAVWLCLLLDVYAEQKALVLLPTSMRLSPAGFVL